MYYISARWELSIPATASLAQISWQKNLPGIYARMLDRCPGKGSPLLVLTFLIQVGTFSIRTRFCPAHRGLSTEIKKALKNALLCIFFLQISFTLVFATSALAIFKLIFMKDSCSKKKNSDTTSLSYMKNRFLSMDVLHFRSTYRFVLIKLNIFHILVFENIFFCQHFRTRFQLRYRLQQAFFATFELASLFKEQSRLLCSYTQQINTISACFCCFRSEKPQCMIIVF